MRKELSNLAHRNRILNVPHGFRQIDLSLFKAFRTFGSQDFKLRVDAFNAFNISSYSGPGNYIG